ncbi:putative dehydroshikimate dehydratase [Pseudovirgaria hyperparasitica]|uniref:Putative dehydroshikimate dehydratase n=1 Tax=Pseudovirgaria hyperparasitica TaxID=470096 RepID=A0A6A6WGF2_9PEZI|nr:putative dehydroshikimate dehydratase [Pseudovirgaria hyperparasitica]KAF2761289.1 putative dehydroshikimate dehydratase [Pseudovirgaria hyperparasitica]
MCFGPAISSMSLGRAWVHELPHKLDMAAKYGFKGIEIFYEDLEFCAKSLPGGNVPENRLVAAREIRKLCDERDLKVICLQPFMHYEGLKDREKHKERIEEMKLWLKLAKTLGTDQILIPSNFLPTEEITSDLDVIVADLVEVADLGADVSPPIRFSYESLAWGTYIDTWDKCWDIVKRVDRANFGICLDTFNIAGRVFADPAAVTGCTTDAEEAIKKTISELIATVTTEKVFLVQVANAERLPEPLIEGHQFYNPEQPARMSWSRNCRLFYGEQDRGAYLPVKEISDAIIHGLGYDGWVSAELFNRRMSDADTEAPEELAKRGGESWKEFVKDLRLGAHDKDVPDIAIIS